MVNKTWWSINVYETLWLHQVAIKSVQVHSYELLSKRSPTFYAPSRTEKASVSDKKQILFSAFSERRFWSVSSHPTTMMVALNDWMMPFSAVLLFLWICVQVCSLVYLLGFCLFVGVFVWLLDFHLACWGVCFVLLNIWFILKSRLKVCDFKV